MQTTLPHIHLCRPHESPARRYLTSLASLIEHAIQSNDEAEMLATLVAICQDTPRFVFDFLLAQQPAKPDQR